MAQGREEIYYSIISCRLFRDEQKGCRKKTKGTDLLYIDPQGEQNETKNQTMAWIHYKKEYDMAPQSLIIGYFKMYKISDKVIKVIEYTIENRWVKLTARGKSLAEVKIQRGIFQEDALKPLLFVVTCFLWVTYLETEKEGTNFINRKKKINHLMYMDDTKLFAKNEKELETLIPVVKI